MRTFQKLLLFISRIMFGLLDSEEYVLLDSEENNLEVRG